MGYACNGMAILPDHDSYQIDHAYIVHTGLEKKIQEAREELERMNSRKIKTQEDLDKVYVLRAMIIIDEAVIRWANRYADLAQKEAEACEDAKRRKLLEMSEACRNVPAKPAKNFREAFQFLYFVFLMQSRQTTTPLGRLDQVLYPFYKKDVAEGILDDELVLEYMQCYRLKIMQMQRYFRWTKPPEVVRPGTLEWRYSGVGVDKDGNDASNELTILFIEAAHPCRTPHHTLHLRVHEKTPMKVLTESTGTGKDRDWHAVIQQ